MAKTLSVKFNTDSGAVRCFTFAKPKDNLDAAAAAGFLAAMAAVGEAFDDALTEGISAELIDRTVTTLVDNSD